MDGEPEPATEGADNRANLLALALLAPFAGAVAGFIEVKRSGRRSHSRIHCGSWS